MGEGGGSIFSDLYDNAEIDVRKIMHKDIFSGGGTAQTITLGKSGYSQKKSPKKNCIKRPGYFQSGNGIETQGKSETNLWLLGYCEVGLFLILSYRSHMPYLLMKPAR